MALVATTAARAARTVLNPAAASVAQSGLAQSALAQNLQPKRWAHFTYVPDAAPPVEGR